LTVLSGRHKGALLSTFRDIDSLLSQIEYFANDDNLRSPFAGYDQDLTKEKKISIEFHVSHIREMMLRILENKGIPIHIQTVGVIKSINTHLTFADISIKELKHYMRGFGKLPDNADEELNEIILEIHSAIDKFKTDLTY
jgi:hypothetical protein